MRKPVCRRWALRAFHAVAGCRSFKLAAEALGVSATAVSHQIAAGVSAGMPGVRAQRAGRQPDRNRRDPVCRHPARLRRAGAVRRPNHPRPAAAGADRHHHLQFLTHWLVPRRRISRRNFPPSICACIPASSGSISASAPWTSPSATAKRRKAICIAPCCMRIALWWWPARHWHWSAARICSG